MPEASDASCAGKPAPEDDKETVAAVRQALAGMRAGDMGIPFERFDAEMRRKHDLGAP